MCYTVASSSCVNKCYSILEYSIYEKFVTKIHFRLVRKKAKFVAGRFFFLRQLCYHQKRLDLKKLLWWPPRSEAVLFSNTPSPSNITQKILEDNKKAIRFYSETILFLLTHHLPFSCVSHSQHQYIDIKVKLQIGTK